MTGRMESVENLGEQSRAFASQQQVFHPSHRPLEIAAAIPTFPQPDDDDVLLQTYKQQNQGDISMALPRGTFLLPLDMKQYLLLPRETHIAIMSFPPLGVTRWLKPAWATLSTTIARSVVC